MSDDDRKGGERGGEGERAREGERLNNFFIISVFLICRGTKAGDSSQPLFSDRVRVKPQVRLWLFSKN